MKAILASLLFSLLAWNAMAQFTGPSVKGEPSTVRQIRHTRPGTYVTVTGHIVAHQRLNYFTFRDDTGEIPVRITNSVWQNRKVGPETKVQLLAEVHRGTSGRFLWVKTLQIVD